MKTYLTIYIPQGNILETICRDIDDIDREKHFNLGSTKYYRVNPFCFAGSGGIVTALTEKQLENINTYQSSITTDAQSILHILENDFDIMYQGNDIMAVIVTFNGDCDEYIGEHVAVEKMVEHLDKLKDLCLNTKCDLNLRRKI